MFSRHIIGEPGRPTDRAGGGWPEGAARRRDGTPGAGFPARSVVDGESGFTDRRCD